MLLYAFQIKGMNTQGTDIKKRVGSHIDIQWIWSIIDLWSIYKSVQNDIYTEHTLE